jgi:hypothetical protein
LIEAAEMRDPKVLDRGRGRPDPPLGAREAVWRMDQTEI